MDTRYFPLMPSAEYMRDAADQVKGAYKQGGLGAAIGTGARAAAGGIVDVAAPVMPAWDAAAQGLKTFVTGDSTPINGLPAAATTAAPAKTQNAVAIANAQNADSQTDRARGKAQAPGQSQAPSPDAVGAVSPGGLPYFTRPTSQAGIERIDVKGQAPLFTNMGGAGLDDLSKKGGQLPSVPGFLAGVPTFGSGAGAANAGSGVGMIAPGGGSGGVLSAMYSKINEYQDQADKLLNSSGIVSQFRGRQLLRARARLINDIAQLGNTDAATMHGNASLAAVGVAQQRANQEAQQNYAGNILKSRELDITDKAHELGFLPKLEDATRGQRYRQAVAAGNTAEAARIAQEGKFAPQQRNPSMQQSSDMQHLFVIHPGQTEPSVYSIAELLKKQKLQSPEAQALTGMARER